MSRPKTARRVKNLALAAVAGLAGFASVVIIFTALFLGLWLDARYGDGESRVFTVVLLCLSVPVSLVVMVTITLTAVKRIIPQPLIKQQTPTEEDKLLKDQFDERRHRHGQP